MTEYVGKPLRAGILVAAALAIWPLAGAYADDDEKGGEGRAYAIGLWGDLPYSDVQAQVGVPNLIDDMNAQKLAFTVHDGDLKAGNGSPCDDALYIRARGWFNSLQSPAIF